MVARCVCVCVLLRSLRVLRAWRVLRCRVLCCCVVVVFAVVRRTGTARGRGFGLALCRGFAGVEVFNSHPCYFHVLRRPRNSRQDRCDIQVPVRVRLATWISDRSYPEFTSPLTRVGIGRLGPRSLLDVAPPDVCRRFRASPS